MAIITSYQIILWKDLLTTQEISTLLIHTPHSKEYTGIQFRPKKQGGKEKNFNIDNFIMTRF